MIKRAIYEQLLWLSTLLNMYANIDIIVSLHAYIDMRIYIHMYVAEANYISCFLLTISVSSGKVVGISDSMDNFEPHSGTTLFLFFFSFFLFVNDSFSLS